MRCRPARVQPPRGGTRVSKLAERREDVLAKLQAMADRNIERYHLMDDATPVAGGRRDAWWSPEPEPASSEDVAKASSPDPEEAP